MTTTAKMASAAALLLVGGYGLWRGGGNAREAEITSRIEDSVAAVMIVRTDSIAARGRARADSAQRATDSLAAVALAKLNAEERRTNAARAAAETALASARRVLEDSLASVDTLRVALTRTAESLDSVLVAGARERAAADSARRTADAAHARERFLWRASYDSLWDAAYTAIEALNRATAARVAEAYGRGKRRGRAEGAVVLGAVAYGVARASR